MDVNPQPSSLRLWPGVAAGSLLTLVLLVLPVAGLLDGGTAMLGGVAGAVLVMVWWLLFSRARWTDRLFAVAAIGGGIWATSFFVHESISNGMMGMMLPMYAIPLSSLALVGSVWAVERWALPRRRTVISAAVMLVCCSFLLIRTGGMTGGATSDLHWRWTPTPEQLLLARTSSLPSIVTPQAASSTPAAGESDSAPAPAGDQRTEAVAADPRPALTVEPEPPASGEAVSRRIDWAGFRGAARDSHVSGVRIATDWSVAPPQELWRKPIGPGWSSFAVQDGLIYTQEQRGDDEMVAAYRLESGEPVWMHKDAARFWESNGGAGPRGTPTLSDGRVYALGATGLINVLDAITGTVVWSRDAARDTGAVLPGWGFSGSPLVVDDAVIVATGGRLIAYEAATGRIRWRGPEHSGGYSSPQLFTINAVPQVVMMSGSGATSLAPSDGAVLWEYGWEGTPIVQPAVLDQGDLLVTTADAMGGIGLRRLGITNQTGSWTLTERWASRSLKPYFNDFVVHQGHAYGFDGAILACVDLADGSRVWKGGRYGNGQLMLLPDQDLMLVLSEEGELALVSATPDTFTELARVPALDGKTWNHPVLVGDTLLVRNGEEMAAFRVRR